VVDTLLAGQAQGRILDVGAWNGWLSHQLARRGHEVTAVDYFIDPHDGLGARQFYSTRWQAIQMDLTDLTILPGPYDVVILNRCLQFAPDPMAFAALAQTLVAPGGMLILTGLQLFFNAHVKAEQVKRYTREHRDQYGFDLFLRPTKGYLDWQDKNNMEQAGIVLRPYPQLRIANMKAWWRRTLPRHFYGFWRFEIGD
jgi:SAM-dependent methyltransferase